MNGIVKEFDIIKGYGYIANEIDNNIFFHYTEVINKKHKKIKKGDIVMFKLEKRNNEYIAKKVLKKN